MRDFNDFNQATQREWYMQGYLDALNDWRAWLEHEVTTDD